MDFHNIVFDANTKACEKKSEIDNTASVGPEVLVAEDFPVCSLPEIEDKEIEDNLAELSEQPVVYLSGYLAYKILKSHQCQNCRDFLTVVNLEKLTDPTYNYISLKRRVHSQY